MDSWGLNCSQGNLTSPLNRGLDLEIDLNYPLPPQIRDLDLSLQLSVYSDPQEVQVQVHGWSHHQTTNVVETADDELAIISPRTFAEAKENSERNRSRGMREVIGEVAGTLRGCSAVPTLCPDCSTRVPDGCKPCLKPETSSKKKAKNVSQPVPVPEESIFSCPICMGPLIESTSTRCGHIFCKECILKSLKSLRSKCPTCRQKVGKRGLFRVYLPTTN